MQQIKRLTMKRYALLPMALLVACGTPQEQCIGRETRELRVLDRLIAETTGNIDRGYALQTVEVSRDRWVLCAPPPALPPAEGAPPPEPPKPRMCLDEVTETETRPVAINLGDEADKLASMKKKRAALAKASAPAIAACKSAYPE
jgi:hypothetical protein